MLYTLNFAGPVVSSTHILILFCVMVLTHPPRWNYCIRILSPPITLLSDETNGDFHFSLVSTTTLYISIYHHFVCFSISSWIVKGLMLLKNECNSDKFNVAVYFSIIIIINSFGFCFIGICVLEFVILLYITLMCRVQVKLLS